MSCLTLIPAYGRDYKSKTAVLADWNAGKDFVESVSGKYINCEDALRYSPTAAIRIRYDAHRKILLVPTMTTTKTNEINRNSDAYNTGYEAAKRGEFRNANPYAAGTWDSVNWLAGWITGLTR